jgi:hypothetical protein
MNVQSMRIEAKMRTKRIQKLVKTIVKKRRSYGISVPSGDRIYHMTDPER